MEHNYKDWIVGFGNEISNQLGTKIREQILNNCEKCENISNDSEMVTCIKEIMDRFDNTVKEETKRYRVMEALGNNCVQSQLKAAEEIREKSEGVKQIIDNLNKRFNSEIFKLEGNKIYITFDRCFCHWGVKDTKEPISITYCHCSLGWIKTFFKTLLGKSVRVDLFQSVITGSDSCKFIAQLE